MFGYCQKKKSINVFNKLLSTRVWVYWEGRCFRLKFPESCWVHQAIASSRQGSWSHQNRLSGQSQNQVINTPLRKHIGLAAGKDNLDVRLVAKLKIAFISPSCHNLQQERKRWQSGFVQTVLTGEVFQKPHPEARYIGNEKFKQLGLS